MKKKRNYIFFAQLFEDGAAGGDGAGSGSLGKEQDAGDAFETETEGTPGIEDTQDEDLDTEFEELIKGKYKDQYQNRVNSAIGRRFKSQNAKDAAGKKVMDAIAMRYGINDPDPDKLLKAIEEDNTLLDEAAAKAGLSPKQYKRMMELEQQNAARSKEDEQRKKSELQEQFSRQLQNQSKACKKLFPDFDFQKEVQNKQFSDMLRAGMDVTSAYKAVHVDEILSGGMKMAMQKGTEKVAAAVRRNAGRAVENGLGTGSAVSTVIDYSKMTDEEFDEFQAKVMRGEV